MVSPSEDQYWVVCPVCHHPNHPGQHVCSKCWSMKIRNIEPVTTSEMQAIVKHYKSLDKRRFSVKVSVITFICLIAAAALTWLFLFTFTDAVSRPSLALNSDSPAGQWTMFRHDLLASGSNGDDTTPLLGEIAWTFETGAVIESSPVVADGIVYFGSRNNRFYALDALTGQEIWTFQATSYVDANPVVADGIVYIGSNDGHLYALEAASGRQVWAFKTPYPVKSTPAIAGEILYFGADDSYIYALDAATGEEIWKYEAESRVESAPVVNNGIVYFTAGSSLYALDAGSGRRRLDFEAYNLVDSSPAVSGSTVYFGSSNGILYAVDGNAKNWLMEHQLKPFWMNFYLWGIAPEPKPQSGTIWGLELGKVIKSSPAVAGGRVYIGVDNSLTAVDVDSYETVWLLPTGDKVTSSPTIASGTVYFGSNDGCLYAVDAAGGQELWSVDTGGPVNTSAAIADGLLYFGSHDGTFYAVR